MFEIDIHTGLINNALYIASPNADARPDATDIDLIVIHSISLPPGEYGGDYIERFFTNRLNPEQHPYFQEIHEMKVSAHALIRRDGSICQFVPFHQRAWHAGESSYKNHDNCNDYSIGIELEGTDSSEFEDAQYQTLKTLIIALEKNYTKINNQRITGHSDIAPGRKTDPGEKFDWNKLHSMLAN